MLLLNVSIFNYNLNYFTVKYSNFTASYCSYILYTVLPQFSSFLDVAQNGY